MADDIEPECHICTESYDRIREPVIWKCCKKWTCGSCATIHIDRTMKENRACPFCRRPGANDLLDRPENFMLSELFKQVDVPMHRDKITLSGLKCSHCQMEKISFEQLFIYLDDPGIIQYHILLAEEKEIFLNIVQMAVCSVCLRKGCDVSGAPVVSLNDIFFAEDRDLAEYSKSFFNSGIQCSSKANAMIGAVLCWRWLYALRCNKVPCDNYTASASFLVKFLKCSFWINLSKAPHKLTEWRNVTFMSIVHILCKFTEIFLKKPNDTLVSAELFHLAIHVSDQMGACLTDTNILGRDLANEILYPNFVRTLEDTTADEWESYRHRYEAMSELIRFHNNKDKAADMWSMFRAECARCAKVRRTNFLDFINEKKDELLICIINYIRRPME